MAKKKKYTKWIEEHGTYLQPVTLVSEDQVCMDLSGISVPEKLILASREDSGVIFGLTDDVYENHLVGMSQGTDGNILVVGGNGSGKSSGIAGPTLAQFKGAICATDIKGELSIQYEELFRMGCVSRPYLVFDPTDQESPSYDPTVFWEQDGETNLISNITDTALALLPTVPNDNQPFWLNTERNILKAALLYYFKLGLSFSEMMISILEQPVSELCRKLTECDDVGVKTFLGEIAATKPETLANFDAGLRSKLVLFASDPYIGHAFRGKREGAASFSWECLEHYNIFLRIPADKIEAWSGAINLIYSQLFRYLERRQEQYSPEGEKNTQILLLMDEFSRFGKLEQITSAMSTLRSKKVNICLIIQSIAQLDKIYGEYDRRIILDNCQFKVILRANDSDTQKYFSELIGTHIHLQRSIGEQVDKHFKATGYSKQISEVREFIVHPHELATLQDALLLSPEGFFRLRKFKMYEENMKVYFLPHQIVLHGTAKLVEADAYADEQEYQVVSAILLDRPDLSLFRNEGATMMKLNERSASANRRMKEAERQKRVQEREEKAAQERRNQRRNFLIGELVTKYFPSVTTIQPVTQDENLHQFENLEAILYVLSIDSELIDDLKDRAAKLVSDDPNGEWRLT